MSKGKNKLNASMGLLSQVVVLIFGLIIPRIVITSYGSDMNGLVSTITQVFTYLALFEAGISQASRNALFLPIKDNDKDTISSVLSASRRYYRSVTLIYAVAVICISFLLPYIFKTQVDYWTIFFIVLFEGFTNVVSFYFINTWSCFLNSSGKTYINTSIELICKSICFITKILLALNGINFAVIQFCFFAVSLIKLAIYYRYMKKYYPWIDYSIKDGYKLKDRNSYIITEVAWVVFSATDMIVLSAFISTSVTSVYSVYSMVYSALGLLLNSIYASLCFNLGQTYHKDKEKYKELHDCFNSVFIGGITCLVATASFLIIPFVRLYTKGVEDTNYIYFSLPLLFALIQFLSWSRYVSGNLTGVAGFAKKVSRISIIEASLNVVFSILLAKQWGIFGVTLATVIALPVKAIYCNYLCEKVILNRSAWKTVKIFLVNISCFVISVIISNIYNPKIDTYYGFVFDGAILFLVVTSCVFLANYVVNRSFIKQFIALLRK